MGLLSIGIAVVGWHAHQPHSPAADSSHSVYAIVGLAHVVDGDTLDLSGIRIRLHGIDAPEARQTCTKAEQTYPCGSVATQALVDLIRGQALRCDPMGIDRFQRTIGRCYIVRTGQDIESWMVRHGYAVAYRRYSYDYLSDEVIARIARRGLWAGTFEWPWDYQHKVQAGGGYRL